MRTAISVIPGELGSDEVADEGLKENGTTMSQIPTYVTAVPNGTEKVEASDLPFVNPSY